MRKKWTYVAIFSMMLGMAPVFTGCIDTDEPAGLEQLRGAKAELLKARIKVEEAHAANILADAALKEAQQAVVAAKARYYEAVAAEQEYKALEQQYLAELQNIKNQEEQAYYENLLNQLRAEQEEREREKQRLDAQLKVQLQSLETQLLQQQALYDEALKDLALAQNTLTEKQKAYLQPWITEVNNAKARLVTLTNDYKQLAEAYQVALETLDEAKSDELAVRLLDRAVELAKRDYDAAVTAYNLAVEAADKDFSSIEAMEQHKAEYEAQLEAMDKLLADIKVERTKLEQQTASEKANVEKLYKAYTAIVGVWDNQGNLTAAGTKEYTLPEIKLQNLNNIAFPEDFHVYNWEIPEMKYLYSSYLQAVDNETVDDFKQNWNLNYYLRQVNEMTRSANDDAWMNSDIMEYEAQLAAVNEGITPIKEKWAAAVKAYQEGYDIDATQMPGYDDLKKVVDEYNTAVTAYNTALNAYEAYIEGLGVAQEEFDKACRDARIIRDQAFEANKLERAAAVNKAEQSVQTAKTAEQEAYAKWDKAAAELAMIANPTEAQKGAVEDLYDAYQNAMEAVYDAKIDADKAIQTAYDNEEQKNRIARADYLIAEAQARRTFIEAQVSNAEINNKLNELWQAVSDAEEDLDEKYSAATEEYNEYARELGIWNNLLWESRYNSDSETGNLFQVDAEELAAISHDQLKYYIGRLSDELFGFGIGSGQYPEDFVRLVDFTVADMKAEIEKNFMSWNPDAEFVPFYYVRDNLQSYGLVGQTGYLQMQIDIAKAVLDNEEAVAALKKELTDGLASVSAAIAKVGEEADAAEKAYADANAAYVAKFADVDKRKAEAEAVKNASQPVINAILDQIKKYLSYEDPNSAESVAELKKLLEDIVTDKEQAMFDQETVYLEAVKAREDFVAEEQDAVDVAYKQLQKKDAELKEAQEELAAANEALLAEIDRISQQTDEVTE